jgi:UDP-N-acetylglucosamine diphosphorylase/glucosamine-1-phosphate N-acetyltransferase
LKAVILAAGEGTRMRPLTYTRPKVMLPIANKPILEHLVTEARQAGIGDFIFVVGYRDEQVREYFGDGGKWGIKIEYCNQRKQLGTADALKRAETLVSDKFLMINGDIIARQKDISRLVERKETTLCVIEVTDAMDLGVIEVKQNKVLRIYEKTANPPSRLANTGLYFFTPDIFHAISQTAPSPRGEYEITESIQWLIDNSHKVSFMKLDYWLDVSYPWDLLEANESLLEKLEAQNLGEVEPNAVLKGAVSIGRNTVIRSGAYIIGPVIIGADCEIGPNCYIRPSTAIGDSCHIGASVEVKNSIVMKGTQIPHHNYVGDSVIGESCNLGAGTKIANLRLDKQNISVGGVDTKRRKLGAIIGDEVQTGINSSINIGTVIGNGTVIGPGALAHGVISPGSKIF